MRSNFKQKIYQKKGNFETFKLHFYQNWLTNVCARKENAKIP